MKRKTKGNAGMDYCFLIYIGTKNTLLGENGKNVLLLGELVSLLGSKRSRVDQTIKTGNLSGNKVLQKPH